MWRLTTTFPEVWINSTFEFSGENQGWSTLLLSKGCKLNRERQVKAVQACRWKILKDNFGVLTGRPELWIMKTAILSQPQQTYYLALHLQSIKMHQRLCQLSVWWPVRSLITSLPCVSQLVLAQLHSSCIGMCRAATKEAELLHFKIN